MQRIQCSVLDRDRAVQAQLPDGSTADISASLMYRSKVLQDLVSAADDDGNLMFTAPEGYLQAWLACVSLVEPPVDLSAQETAQILQFLLVCCYDVQLLQLCGLSATLSCAPDLCATHSGSGA